VLFPERQLLLQGEAPVRIGCRALDILTTLVEHSGDVVSKNELLARVWPDTTVQESNLKVNMAALRRVLGEEPGVARYIATVVGRGYRFVAPVLSGSAGHAFEASPASARNHNLPTATTRIFGRAEVIDAIGRDLTESRLVSIVGAGGIGKTTVALAVAEHALRQFKDGVWLIDLALLKDPDWVPNAIATAIGVVARLPDMLAALSDFLRERELLLVLDSCEHLIDAAASAANRILADAAGVRILVTSREPLMVNGERVRRLKGLDTPPAAASSCAKEALEFSAIQLFVERASDRLESFDLSDADAPAVAEICRRLDGIAIAIELAATRVDVFGVRSLLKQLDDRFRLLTGRRGGPERHRTLTATLDWSYSLLSAHEAALLRAVSVFVGVFDIDGASALAHVAPSLAASTLAQLAAKSLLAADVDHDGIAYRLLESTRSYCLEHLRLDGEEHAVRRRHAERVCSVLEQAASERAQRPDGEWVATCGRLLDDLRAALAWAGRDAADPALYIRLTVAGLPLWNHFSLTEECRVRVSQAVEELDAAGLAGTAAEIQLLAWLGGATLFTLGLELQAVDAMRRALEIATRLGDTEHRLRCLRMIGTYEVFTGEYAAGMRTLEDFAAIAATKDPSAQLEGETHIGVAELFLGRLHSSRRRLERLDERALQHDGPTRGAGYLSDRIIDLRCVLSQVQWLTGSPDAAARTAASAIERARSMQHHLSLTTALSYACPILFWNGHYEECGRHVAMLDEHVTRHGFVSRRPVTHFYRAVAACAQSDRLEDDLRALERAVAEFHATTHLARLPFYLGVLAEFLARAGRLCDAEATIGAALASAETKDERWCVPELLRIRASILAAQSQVGEAEALLVESMTMAQQIGALAWRLRAATDLARLWGAGSRGAHVRGMLQPIVGQFTEGFATRDLEVAARLLA